MFGLFTKHMVKCFYCRKKVKAKHAELMQYDTLEGSQDAHLCKECSAELELMDKYYRKALEDE